MNQQQAHQFEKVAQFATIGFGILAGLAWLGDKTGIAETGSLVAVLAALTAISGVSIGVGSMLQRDVALGHGRGLALARSLALWFTAACGVMIGFAPERYTDTFVVLASIGGITMGLLWAVGPSETAS